LARARPHRRFDADQVDGCHLQLTFPVFDSSTGNPAMTTGSIVILSGIVLAFAAFAVVLMWGDLYSRRTTH
jgi:hypothetical protein